MSYIEFNHELLGLSWRSVDFTNRTRDRYGFKETTKTHRMRMVRMNKVVFNYLKDLKNNSPHPDIVYTKANGEEFNIRHISDRSFKKAIKIAGVKRIRFHDLRTTYACNFMMSGGDIFELSKILGHTSVDMTAKKYAFLSPDYLLNASEIISFRAHNVDDSPNLDRPKLELVN